MAFTIKDRVKETTTTTGTGSYTLAGAADGYQSFASALSDGDTTWYGVEDGTDWEVGLGTIDTAAGTLARTTVYSSSNSGNAVNWGAGTKNVFVTLPAARVSTVTVYPTIDDLPLTGNVQAGDQAYVTGNNRLYLYNGTGWFNIALVNQTPTVSGNSAAYELASDGTATVVTLSATDPEGIPITWSHVATGLTNEATVTNVDNVFTITPSTDSANAGEFSITFRASDGVNIGTASSEFTLSFISALWKDASLSIGTSATNGLDNSTFIDRSTNAHTVTPTGSPVQTAFHPYLDNWSVEFSTDRVDMSSVLVGPTTSTFTVECWVNLFSLPTANVSTSPQPQGTVTLDGVPGGSNNYHTFGVNTDGTVGLRWFDGSGKLATGATVLDLGKWYHIACVVDSNSIQLYVDGVAESMSGTTTLTNRNGTTGQSAFGSNYWTTFNGHISNLRVTHSAVYTSAFTPSSENLTSVTNTQLLTCQSNRFIDNSSSNRALTLVNNPVVSAFNPFGQESEYAVGENKGSTYFDGNTTYMNAPWSTMPSGTENFTIQYWIYETDTGTSYGTIGLRAGASDSYMSFFGFPTEGWYFLFNDTTVQAGATGGKNLNQWSHHAIVRDGNNFTFYINGAIHGTATFSGSLDKSYTDALIGAVDAGGTREIENGNIADLQIIKGTALYTSAFTPPTAPVGNTNAYLYLPMDNAGVYDKTGNQNLPLFGNVSTSTTQTKFADTAIYFDGSGDYIRANESLSLIASTSSLWTIEGWGYALDLGGTGSSSDDLIGINRLSDGYNVLTHGPRISRYRGSVVAVTSWNLNEWTHFAMTYDGTTYRIFLNGTLDYSTAEEPTVALSECSLLIGAEADAANGGTVGNYFNGYLENLQILNGVAKYTANFTVPDREQGQRYQAES